MKIKVECQENIISFRAKTGEMVGVEKFERDVVHFSLEVEGVGKFSSNRLKSMVEYDRLQEKSKWRMWQIVILCVLLLALDIYLFFVLPFQLVASYDMGMGIDFSPIPIGATIAICGIQAGCIATLFHQYKEESKKADYIFRGKEAYPSNPEK